MDEKVKKETRENEGCYHKKNEREITMLNNPLHKNFGNATK